LKAASAPAWNAPGVVCAALEAAGIAALLVAKFSWKETPDELFDVVVPDSEQFNLQQSLAIETAAVACRERAFLQHAGRFGIGHDALLSCAPIPTAEFISTEIRTQAVNHFRIDLRISSNERDCQRWLKDSRYSKIPCTSFRRDTNILKPFLLFSSNSECFGTAITSITSCHFAASRSGHQAKPVPCVSLLTHVYKLITIESSIHRDFQVNVKQQFLNDSGALAIVIQDSAEVDEPRAANTLLKAKFLNCSRVKSFIAANQRDGVFGRLGSCDHVSPDCYFLIR